MEGSSIWSFTDLIIRQIRIAIMISKSFIDFERQGKFKVLELVLKVRPNEKK